MRTVMVIIKWGILFFGCVGIIASFFLFVKMLHPDRKSKMPYWDEWPGMSGLTEATIESFGVNQIFDEWRKFYWRITVRLQQISGLFADSMLFLQTGMRAEGFGDVGRWAGCGGKRCGCDYLDRCEATKYFTILGQQQCILDTVFTICNSSHFDHMFILVHATCKPFIWKHASLTQVGLTTECVHIWLIQRIEGMVLFDLLQNQLGCKSCDELRAYTMNH